MDAALLALLTDTVTHEAQTGRDAYGKPTYGAAVARPARVEWTTRRFVNAQGQDAISRAVLYFAWDFTLDARDRLTLEDGSTPTIQRIERVKDEQGTQDHLRVFL